jgi:hypothetical protein
MSNGVRNLRAMFENSSAASSPEPRGRSPVDYIAAGDSDDRPKSKVRANFVSVEPTSAPNSAHASTDLTPTNNINAHRRESFRVSEDKPDELADLKQSVSDEKEERRKSLSIPEAVPEQAVASRESSVPAPPLREEPAGEIRKEPAGDMTNLGSIMKGSDFPEPSPRVEEKEPEVPEPAADMEEAAGEETPAASESEQKPAEVAEPAPEPSPETAPAQPAENPDEATTGEQVDLALRPAVPTEDDDVADETSAVDEAAVQDETDIAEDAALANEEPHAPAPAAGQPADNPDNAVTGAQEDVSLRPAAPADETAVSDGKTLDASEDVPTASSEAPLETPKAAVDMPKTNGAPIAKKPEPKKPAAISTANSSKTPSTSAKSPLPKSAPKTPTTPKAKAAAPVAKSNPAVKAPKPAAAASKPAAPKEPVKVPVTKALVAKAPAAKAPVAKTSRTSLRPAASSSSATAPTASAAAKTTKPSAAPVENKKPAATKPAASAPRTRYVQCSKRTFIMLTLFQHLAQRLQEAAPKIAYAPCWLTVSFDRAHRSLSSQAWRRAKGHPEAVYHNPSCAQDHSRKAFASFGSAQCPQASGFACFDSECGPQRR